MKRRTSVELDIARFVFEVFSRDDDALIVWTRSLAESLATRNPLANTFGASLLNAGNK
jgi:hypothetical protein